MRDSVANLLWHFNRLELIKERTIRCYSKIQICKALRSHLWAQKCLKESLQTRHNRTLIWKRNEFRCLLPVLQTSKAIRQIKWTSTNIIVNNKWSLWQQPWSDHQLQDKSRIENHEMDYKIQQMDIGHQASTLNKTGRMEAKLLIAWSSSQGRTVSPKIITHRISHSLWYSRHKTSSNRFEWITWIQKQQIPPSKNLWKLEMSHRLKRQMLPLTTYPIPKINNSNRLYYNNKSS